MPVVEYASGVDPHEGVDGRENMVLLVDIVDRIGLGRESSLTSQEARRKAKK